MQLRDYQQESVDAAMDEIKSGNFPLVVMPCGAGKTECFLALTKEYIKQYPKNSVLILLNRVMLWEQTLRRTLNAFPSDKIGNVCGSRGKKSYKQITIGTVKSVSKEQKFDLTILDEAHRVSDSYNSIISNSGILASFTATPFNNKGYIYGKDKLSKKITYKKDLIWMIEQGYLVKPIIRKSTEEFDLNGVKTKLGDWDQKDLEKKVLIKTKAQRQVKDALSKAFDRKHLAWCCVNITHAEMIKETLKEFGEQAVVIHSQNNNNELSESAFRAGRVRHIVFVTILAEGIDIPHIDCLVMLRPTKSSVLYVQVAGRGLRLAEGKKDCLFLDYGRVVENCGALDNPIVRGAGRGNVISQGAPVKFCPSCLTMIHAAMRECEFCGYEYPAPTADKNLTSKSDDRDILSSAVKEKEWIPIKPYVAINKHTTKKGAECLRVTYYPVSFFKRPINEYIMDFNMNKKLAKLELDAKSVERWIGFNYKTNIVQVCVDYQNGFANIVETL